MPIKKHDWIKYKQDYFNSDIDEVIQFFAGYPTVVPKNTFQRSSQGWFQQKQEFKKQQAEAARAKAANDPDVKDLTSQLIKGKANALKIVLAKLVKERDELGMRDLREGIDIIKRELGEPLTISENKNKNENEFCLGEDFKRLLSGYVGIYGSVNQINQVNE